MEVRLLGPLEVLAGGAPVPLPRAERALLALLALQPARVVPVDALVDALWEARLPADPGNAVQQRVWKLRTSLARLDGDLPAADRRYQRALRWLEGADADDWAVLALVGRGYLAELAGDLDEAAARHRAAWDRARGNHIAAGAAAAALEGLAGVAAGRGDGVDAAGLLGAAAAWRERHHRPATAVERPDIERSAGSARELLGPAAYDAVFTAARRAPRPPLD